MKDFGKYNVPVLSVDKTVDTLGKIYVNALKSNIPFKEIPSIMLWGPPGVGKSQATRQLAEIIERESGKRCNITDVRLLLFNPIDLRGIPTANIDKTLAIWLKPQIFQMDEGRDVVNILFLDEISAAPQSVQAAAYQITLDRVVGEHKLPENCIVLAAGNRITDKSVAFKMPKALANRLCHIEIEPNFESWRRWAVSSGISDKVLGFLSFRHDMLIENENAKDDLAYPTPRSWEMVSNLIKLNNNSVDGIYPLIAGCVGGGVATELTSWCRVFASLPKIEDIFRGRVSIIPQGTDALYALVSSMTSYARAHKSDMIGLEYSIEYGIRLPADYSIVLMKNYMAIEPEFKTKLMRFPSFAKWVSTKGKFLNGT